MHPYFFKRADKQIVRSGKGWTYTPIGQSFPAHIRTEEAVAQVRHAHASFVFLACVEGLATLVLLFVSTVITTSQGNPLAAFGIPFQIIAVLPLLAIGIFYLRYRMVLRKWLSSDGQGTGPTIK
jgi:hypothetical protein